jgi:hypothetical protein
MQLAGAMLMGGQPADGRLVDLRWVAGPAGGVLSGVHLDKGAGRFSYVLAVDAGVAGVLDVPEGGVATLSAGSHDVGLLVQRQGGPAVDVAGEVGGRRARLSWAASTDADVVGYVVEGLAPGEEEWEELGRVTEIVVGPTVFAGTGSGRVRALGPFIGVANREAQVEILEDGRWTDDGGSTSRAIGSGGIQRGVSGVTWEFLDPAGLYDEGEDTFTTWVGPGTEAVTPELSAGVWGLRVRAIDAAGNVGDASGTVSVFVLARPEAPTGLAAVYDDALGEVTVSWELPTDATRTGLRIYTNVSQATGLPVDGVIEDEVVEDLADDVTSWEMEAEPGWTVKVRVRAVNAAGVEDDGLELAVLEVVEAVTSLTAPVLTGAVAGPGGSVVVSWSHAPLADDGTTEFSVRVDGVEEAVVYPAESGLAVDEYEAATGGVSGTVSVVVVATDGLSEAASNAIEVTVDATGPGAPSGLGALN